MEHDRLSKGLICRSSLVGEKASCSRTVDAGDVGEIPVVHFLTSSSF